MGEVLDLKNLFSNIYSKDEVKINALMKEHINFEVGGPADILLIPSKVECIYLDKSSKFYYRKHKNM